jgi:hypothetical protein
MKTNQLRLFIIIIFALGSFVATGGAQTAPYFEDFESYIVGDTMVTNFTEESTLAWTIVAALVASLLLRVRYLWLYNGLVLLLIIRFYATARKSK